MGIRCYIFVKNFVGLGTLSRIIKVILHISKGYLLNLCQLFNYNNILCLFILFILFCQKEG